MTIFTERVVKIVKLIPKGKVASYGQIAVYLGIPRASRQVGWVLNQNRDKTVPWWRIVNNEGRLSIKGSEYSALDQKEKLENEGIRISDKLTFEIEKYRFLPDQTFLKKLKLDDLYLEIIKSKIGYSKPFFDKNRS